MFRDFVKIFEIVKKAWKIKKWWEKKLFIAT